MVQIGHILIVLKNVLKRLKIQMQVVLLLHGNIYFIFLYIYIFNSICNFFLLFFSFLFLVLFHYSALFQNKTSRGQDTKSEDDELWTSHESAISDIAVVSNSTISTAALDGRIVIWDLPTLNISLSSLGL